MPCRCPRCGGFRRSCPNQAQNQNQVRASTRVTTNPMERCLAPDSVSEELYAGIVPATVCVRCCDPAYGCRGFDLACRNPFWPDFCHPRWLSCSQLYNCCP